MLYRGEKAKQGNLDIEFVGDVHDFLIAQLGIKVYLLAKGKVESVFTALECIPKKDYDFCTKHKIEKNRLIRINFKTYRVTEVLKVDDLYFYKTKRVIQIKENK